MPRSCAMYTAVLVSAGTAPTTRFAFSSAPLPGAGDEFELPQALARANDKMPRTAVATFRLAPAILMSTPWAWPRPVMSRKR
jgi:hypothetical protein